MNRLAIAVIHYHLRPGGVTRVIERAVESLGGQADLLILTGEAPAPAAELAPLARTFAPLGYADEAPPNPVETAEELRALAREGFGRDPDLWHIHNHSLGKNSFTPQLVWHLANAGCRLLLQPHDFAEDGRPENYRLLRSHLGNDLQRILYPLADQVWYAPINFRDQGFLLDIGLPHVHALPNAVSAHPASPAAAPSKTVVYPARAIRRKNIGEFLLWSLLAPEGFVFQSTLAPKNPTWQGYYNDWVAFAKELDLPVEFDAGRKHDFAELVQNATALISTSIAEGFGLAFLEPWLEGKLIIGRKLPEITTDFEADGLDLSTLYTALPVPLEWAGEALFCKTLETAMKQSYGAYSKVWNADYLEQAKAAMVLDGKVDFGILDEEMQRNVIRHFAENPDDRDQLPAFRIQGNDELIHRNRTIIQERYGLKAYGERLQEVYQQLGAINPGPVSSANAAALLDEFLQPQRFNLLRT